MASAKNGTQKTAENESVTLTKNSVAKQESVYTIDEFCRNAQVLFGTMSECVRAALKEKGIKYKLLFTDNDLDVSVEYCGNTYYCEIRITDYTGTKKTGPVVDK